MQFEFKASHEEWPKCGFAGHESVMRFKADELNQVLQFFTEFLRGLGYQVECVGEVDEEPMVSPEDN